MNNTSFVSRNQEWANNIPRLRKYCNLIHQLADKNKVNLCWIPGHEDYTYRTRYSTSSFYCSWPQVDSKRTKELKQYRKGHCLLGKHAKIYDSSRKMSVDIVKT